jgi:hypothetical protein
MKVVYRILSCDAKKIESERTNALENKKRERDETWDICRNAKEEALPKLKK